MIIPYAQLSAEIFDGILQDLASREGTDYGECEMPIPQKAAQLKSAIERKQCYLVFDEVTESIGVITHDDAKQQQLL